MAGIPNINFDNIRNPQPRDKAMRSDVSAHAPVYSAQHSTAQHESVSSPHSGGTEVAKITDFDRTIRKARHHLQLPTHRLNMTAQS